MEAGGVAENISLETLWLYYCRLPAFISVGCIISQLCCYIPIKLVHITFVAGLSLTRSPRSVKCGFHYAGCIVFSFVLGSRFGQRKENQSRSALAGLMRHLFWYSAGCMRFKALKLLNDLHSKDPSHKELFDLCRISEQFARL